MNVSLMFIFSGNFQFETGLLPDSLKKCLQRLNLTLKIDRLPKCFLSNRLYQYVLCELKSKIHILLCQ